MASSCGPGRSVAIGMHAAPADTCFNTYYHAFAISYADSNSYAYAQAHADTNSNSGPDAHGNADSYFYSYPCTHADP